METEDDEPVDSLIAAVARIPVRDLDPHPTGSTCGRYEIVRRLGAGGMGVVYEAKDPELDRRVAVKVLLRDSTGERLVERLRREGQVLAKLSHPNVVTVFDVGRSGTDLYIVMQLVDGPTLGDHLASAPHSLIEIVDLFLAAGRGLAAAHDAGIVHRDFKPSNVLVGRGGTAQVSDFGLAREAQRDDDGGDRAPGVGSPASTQALTQPGAVLGTPRYMAPEQVAGEDAGARTDVFAFALSLYEALANAGFATGSRLPELRDRMHGGKAKRGAIPAWLVGIIERGTASDPGQRFATAGELVAALERGRGRRRRRWIVAGAGAVAIAFGAMLWIARREPVNPCEHSADDAAAVWNVGTPVTLAIALVGDPSVARHVTDVLGRRNAAWQTMRIEACVATKVRGAQSDALLDRRNDCLDRRLGEVRGLVARFTEPLPARELSRVVDIVDGLPALAMCADTHALMARVPPPDSPALRGEVDRLRRGLDDAWSLEELGRHDAALAAGKPLRVAAHASGYLPLEAETLALLSSALSSKGDVKRSEALLRERVEVAARAKDDVQLADTYAAMLDAIGGDAGARHAEALQLIPVAEAAALRAGDARATIKMLRNSGIVYQLAHQPDEAERRFKRVLEVEREAFPDDVAGVAKAHDNLCTVYADRGDVDRALASCTRAVELWRQARGAHHPSLAGALINLATVDMQRGSYAQARDLLVESSAISERAGQADHAVIALINVSELDRVDHKYAQALDVLARVRTLVETQFGHVHPFMAAALMLIGRNEIETGKLDDAEQHLQASLAMVEQLDAHDDEGAALRLHSLGEIRRRQHRPSEAIPLLERALRLAPHAEPDELGALELELARALRAAGQEARALEHARNAKASLTAAGPGAKTELGEADAFLVH